MRFTALGTFALSFLLCAAAPVHAQDAPSSFLTWLHHAKHNAADHRAAASAPLPRRRPAEPTSALVTPNKTSARIPD